MRRNKIYYIIRNYNGEYWRTWSLPVDDWYLASRFDTRVEAIRYTKSLCKKYAFNLSDFKVIKVKVFLTKDSYSIK
jgi:hypothetical protein